LTRSKIFLVPLTYAPTLEIAGTHRLGNRPAGGHRIVLSKGDRQFHPILEKLVSFCTTTKRGPPLRLHFLIYIKYWVQKLLLDRANGSWQDMLVCQPPCYLIRDASFPYYSLKGITMRELQRRPGADHYYVGVRSRVPMTHPPHVYIVSFLRRSIYTRVLLS
jgi:hypothetical protein